MAAAGRAAPRGMTLSALMRKFGRRFWFGTAEVRDHVSHVAVRRGAPSEPGLYIVITADLGEMAGALEQDQAWRDSRDIAAGPDG